MSVKRRITLYTEGLISGLEKYCAKNGLPDESAELKPFTHWKVINANPVALALVINKYSGKVLVQLNPAKFYSYDLPLTNVEAEDEFYNCWKTCLKNLKDNYGIVAQIGDGLGTIFPMQRISRKFNAVVGPKITKDPFKQYQVFEMKSYEQTEYNKNVWKDFETVFSDLLRWRKYEQVEALLRSKYVSGNTMIQKKLAHLNYFRLKKWQYGDSNYLYSSFQKNSMNVFSSYILRQKVGGETYILLAKKGKRSFAANDFKNFWTLPQFPVKLSDYPNFQDIPAFYLGDHLSFANSLLFVKVLFSAPAEDKSSFYDSNIVSYKKDQLLNWEIERISKDLIFDFTHLNDGLMQVRFEKKHSRKKTKNKPVNTRLNVMANGMLCVDPFNNVYVENYYFDSEVFVKGDEETAGDAQNPSDEQNSGHEKHPLDPIYKGGITYCWVKVSDAAAHFAETGNKVESAIMRNYSSESYGTKRKNKLSFAAKEKFKFSRRAQN